MRIFSDDVFLLSFSHNLLLIALSLLIQLPLSLGCALLVGRHLRGRTVFRMIYFSADSCALRSDHRFDLGLYLSSSGRATQLDFEVDCA